MTASTPPTAFSPTSFRAAFTKAVAGFALVCALSAGGCSPHAQDAQAGAMPLPPPMPVQRCLNISNALEAPREGEWGYPIRTSDMRVIAAAGFDGVRVPVRWDQHTGPAPGYQISTSHMERVAEVVDAALNAGLSMVLDVHHFDDLYENPNAQRAHFIAIWRQISQRFAGYPPRLVFEVLNEPRGDMMTPQMVARLNADALSVIRPLHPNRLVIVGGPNWNSIDGLKQFIAPRDPNIAVTFHYYDPFEFSHHMAEWMNPKPHFDRRWGTQEDFAKIRADFQEAAAAAQRFGVPVFLGEFGVNEQVPLDQRALWVREVRRNAEQIGAGWCHFDFTAAFPLYDRKTERWISPMLTALFDTRTPRAELKPTGDRAQPDSNRAGQSWNSAR